MTSYRQELEKYRDIDEDKILQEMSPEELAQLDAELAEMDPENVLLPAGLRQRDQTQKSPTGPLDREALLQHLERQALETAILGMYTLMSNKQYYDAICSGTISNTEGINSVVQPDRYPPVLNLESNFISAAGMLRVLGAVPDCRTLAELRVDNQCHRFGDTVEMAMAAMLEQCPCALCSGDMGDDTGVTMVTQGGVNGDN
ncbi:tropomodulin-4-like, partial [Malurus melanocephalus]|uniref:tropomodulin-4-like n=1 Tax=Malurus melanocephalus TaxID=175006 RepID=UPI0025485C47